MFESRRVRSLACGLTIASLVAAVSAGYEVKPGDTLGGIAREHGTTVAEIVSANGLADPDLIRIGQVLTIPGTEPGGQRATHVVGPGETLARIAATHGITVTALLEANAIPDPNLITIGQELLVPAVTAAGAPPEATAEPVIHVVQPGESLAAIASRYGTTATAIAAANGITDPSVIYAGTSLLVDGDPVAVVGPSEASTSTHVVSAGETLSAIAARYETTVRQIMDINRLADPNLIVIGDRLTVPGGAWVCPVVGARYFNDWGFPRSGGRFHQGTDLFAARGTEVRAPVSGTVELRTGTVGGLQFWLTGDDGNLYIGTHMDGFGVAGRVAAGDVIGYVGDTGNARGSSPHLHFEVHVGGSPVNPYPTLATNAC